MNRSGAHLTQKLRAQKLRVMLVDDEGLARNFLRRMLAKDDDIQEIQECSSASEARERIQQCCPDILFLDVKMPGLSGFDLLEKLSEEDQPVVVFTTAFANYAPRAFDIQACDYVMKPFDEDRLFLALDRAKEALRNQLRRARSPFRITVADRGFKALAAMGAAGTVDLGLKLAFDRQFPTTGNGAGKFWGGGRSFPSGHAATSFAFAAVVAHRYPHNRLLKWSAYALATGVSLSRYPAKKHFPSDILMGATLGYVTGAYLGDH